MARFPAHAFAFFIAALSIFVLPAARTFAQAPPSPATPALSPAQSDVDALRKQTEATFMRGDRTAALRFAEQAYDRVQSIPDDPRFGFVLSDLGTCCAGLGLYDRALGYERQSLEILKKSGNPQQIATCLNTIAITDRGLGRFRDADDALQQELSIGQTLKDRRILARALLNLGMIATNINDDNAAITDFSRALEIFASLPAEETNVARTLNNFGEVYGKLGQHDKAVDCLSEALALREKEKNDRDVSQTLCNLSSEYLQADQLDKAIAASKRALDLAQKINDPAMIAFAETTLGTDYFENHQYAQALDCHTRALTIRQSQGTKEDQVADLVCIGLDQIGLKQYPVAEEWFSRAAEGARPLNDIWLDARLQNDLGFTHDKEGRLDQADHDFSEAIESYEAMSREALDPANVALLEGTDDYVYNRAASLRIRLKRPADALVVAERGRAQGLARESAMARIPFTEFLSTEDAQMLDAKQQAAAETNARLRSAQTHAATTDDPAVQAAAKEVDDAQRAYEVSYDALLSKYPAYSRVEGQAPPTFAQIQRLVGMQPKTLYLEYAVTGDSTTLLFALSRAGLTTFLLPVDGRSLSTACRRWNIAITSASPDEPALAARVSNAILAPLEQSGLLDPGKTDHLVFVFDGPLQAIAPAALEDAQGRRLVERFAVSEAVSLGTLTWPKNTRPPRQLLLAAADPAGVKPEQIAANPSAPLPASPPASGGTQMASLRAGYAPLAHARTEAKTIAALFPGRATALFGPAAREADVKAAMPQYAILHFATHGSLDESNGLRSWLLLAPEPEGSSEDGLLDGREIASMQLSARLAVLSACGTAQGQQAGGDGRVGLAWAFQAAGCPAVVASQWPVDDAATSDLMIAFYRCLKAGLPKDEALRRAMLSVMKTRPAPFYWAAFSVIGDPEPIFAAPRAGKR